MNETTATSYSVINTGLWTSMSNGISWWINQRTATTARFVSNMTRCPRFWIAIGK